LAGDWDFAQRFLDLRQVFFCLLGEAVLGVIVPCEPEAFLHLAFHCEELLGGVVCGESALFDVAMGFGLDGTSKCVDFISE